MLWLACFAALSFASNPRFTQGRFHTAPSYDASDKIQVARAAAQNQVLEDVFQSLTTLQDKFYQADAGTWPTAIDWTAAVIGTDLAGTVTALSQALDTIDGTAPAKENLISLLFSDLVSYYFGQDDIAIRNQVRHPLARW